MVFNYITTPKIKTEHLPPSELCVRLLVSCWLNTDPRMFPFLRSLQALSNPAANVSMDVVRMSP